MAEEFKLSHTAAQIDAKLSKIDSLAEKSELPTKTSDLANDSGFATENYVQQYAQPIGDYALKGEIPSVDLSDYALKSEIPTDYLTEIPEGYVTEEELQNKGFLTEYIETDPSVPAWAKAEKKPTYSAKEVGALPADTVIPVKTSDLVNDSGFITGYSETDPTVPSWAKQPNKPVYTAEEVGALPSSTVVPTKVSELENDRKFLTEYVETDPSVPAWAKSPNKPIYTAEEVGALPSNTVIPTVPTNVSAFTNDAGYLTEHQSLAGLATEQFVTKGLAQKQPVGDYALKSDIPESEVLIVTATEQEDGSVIASHSPAEIKAAVDDGKFVTIYIGDGLGMFDLQGASDTLAQFAGTFVEANSSDSYVMTFRLKIAADKTITFTQEAGLILPVERTVGQIAKVGSDNLPVWSNPDLFIITIDATDPDNPVASHSSTEINTAISEGRIPVLYYNGGMFTCLAQLSSETSSYFGGTIAENSAVEIDAIIRVGADKTVWYGQCATANISTPTAEDAGRVLTATGMDSWEWADPSTITSGFATETYVAEAISGKADKTEILSAVEGLASEEYVDEAVAPFVIVISDVDLDGNEYIHSNCTPDEIEAAANNGKQLLVRMSGALTNCSLVAVNNQKAVFELIPSYDDSSFSFDKVRIIINEDKSVDSEYYTYKYLPDGGVDGQILSINDTGDAEWINKPVYTASDVGADASGSADNALSEANSYTDEMINAMNDVVVGVLLGMYGGDVNEETETPPTIRDIAHDEATTAVANLVNSAPDALNTLDELAAALGDDQNFAATVTNQIATKADAEHTHDYNDLENKTHYIDKELKLIDSGEYTVTGQIYVEFGYPDVIVCTCDGVEYTLNNEWVGGTGYWGYDEFQAGTSPVYFESNATGDAQSINVVDDGKAHEVVYSTYYATNVYVPLDERFIPETIARASDVATKADAVHAHSWSEIKDNPFDDVVAKDLTLLESGECTVTKLENFLINSYCDTIVCTCDDVEYTFDVVFNDGCYYWGYDEFQAGTSPIYFWSNVTLDGGEIRVVDDGQPHAVTYSTYRVTEVYNPIDSKFIGNDIARVEDIPDITAPRDEFILNSSTEGSTKQFKITIDDTGTLTVSEIV